MRNISDWELNEYYARNYYGAGTNYFEPPEYDEFDFLDDEWKEEDEEWHEY